MAKEVTDAGRVWVNGRVAKAATDVKVEDVLRIRYGNRITEVRVLQVTENPRKEVAAEMYEVLQTESTTDTDTTSHPS